MKITPAHDFNDFQVGKRARPAVDQHPGRPARINAADTPDVPADYAGMDRFAARKAIVARAEEEGWLKEIEKTRHMVPHGDRSGVVIEPWLTDQWYVDAKTLAQPAIKAVEQGDTVFEPQELGEDLFRVAAQHRALVHLAPAVVGPPHPGLVRRRRQDLRRRDRGRGRSAAALRRQGR